MDCCGSAAHPDVMWQALPVPWFGNVLSERVKVATVGLNPSWREFRTEGGVLRNSRERLPVVTDFGAKCRYEITGVQAQQAALARAKYFVLSKAREPNTWFKKLQGVMAATVRATGRNWSYADGTAVHLDIVACATCPTWSKLNTDAQDVLVNKCFPKFSDTLSRIPPEAWLLLDGQKVFDTVSGRCGAVVSCDMEVGTNPPLHVWRGRLSSAFGTREFIGWSNPVNWQKNQKSLVEWLRHQVRQAISLCIICTYCSLHRRSFLKSIVLFSRHLCFRGGFGMVGRRWPIEMKGLVARRN